MAERWRVFARLCDEGGQGTLEYALVLFAFVATIVSLGAVWHAVRDGVLLQKALDAAGHALQAGQGVASSQDLLLF